MSAQPLPASGSSAFPSGTVTGTAHPGTAWPGTAWPEPAGPPASRRPAPRLLWFGLAGAVVLAGGLALVLVLTVGGPPGSGRGPFGAAPPPDVRPPLARLCPAPTANEPEPTATPTPAPASGPRTVDEKAGISYRAYGEPWESWPYVWRMGTLEVPYGVGQFFVTENYSGGQYLASILSAAVPATVNDSTAIDLECTGRQVAADVRAEYYPQPTEMELMRDERTTLGGRPAWVTKFRLHFERDGLRAKDELVVVALIDVGRPTVAVLYVSIPGTHPQWDHVVDEVLVSVRPL